VCVARAHSAMKHHRCARSFCSDRRIRLSPGGDALLVIDVQNDFLPGGALAAPSGNLVIEPINRCIHAFQQHRLPIFATRDWHPPDHCSFRAQGGPWPAHCVAGTHGALFASDLLMPADARVVSKGTDPTREAYSGFQGTDLAIQLRDVHCTRVVLGGLATDYCVAATALDARAAGFEVVVLEDAIAGVNLRPHDTEDALKRMVAAGVRLSVSLPIQALSALVQAGK
jgi:nicotinamidase/pyrazinamidase